MEEQVEFCKHVYEEVVSDPCWICKKPSHKTRWALTHMLHNQWIEDGNADWNICPQGGTIRGWWSI